MLVRHLIYNVFRDLTFKPVETLIYNVFRDLTFFKRRISILEPTFMLSFAPHFAADYDLDAGGYLHASGLRHLHHLPPQ